MPVTFTYMLAGGPSFKCLRNWGFGRHSCWSEYMTQPCCPRCFWCLCLWDGDIPIRPPTSKDSAPEKGAPPNQSLLQAGHLPQMLDVNLLLCNESFGGHAFAGNKRQQGARHSRGATASLRARAAARAMFGLSAASLPKGRLLAAPCRRRATARCAAGSVLLMHPGMLDRAADCCFAGTNQLQRVRRVQGQGSVGGAALTITPSCFVRQAKARVCEDLRGMYL